MFLTVLVPGPHNPKNKLDIFRGIVGVPICDISLKQNFQMRAILMWTISDFPAHYMLSGWSTAGRLDCPRCMENTYAFTLEKSGKNHGLTTIESFYLLIIHFEKIKKHFEKTRWS